ncbi:MAG TPA: DNA-processing protein DprA [Pseudomonadales bacterium]|nr:DNA-processing protein DprA [Pseudomonadales bacterium]
MSIEQNIHEWLVLHRLLGGNPGRLIKLHEYFGSPGAALREATPPMLAELGIDEPDAFSGEAIYAAQRAAERDARWLAGSDRCLLRVVDADYPQRLKEIHDPPPLLFCHGNVSLLVGIQIAMVGSRRMTATGRQIAKLLSGELVAAGITVTSGLARGVDAAAHQGALDAEGNTIAVLGSGCDVIYPPRNASLARRILAQDGLIVSEFPLGTGARNFHFPQRNRIVTGMSVGTVVVEAALKSGSLISARLAMEQGREVFAVPGSILNPLSAGCHKLIRDGAKLTERLEDILEELEGMVLPASRQTPPEPDGALARVFERLAAEPISVDELVELSGMPVDEILAALIELEIDGLAVTQGGGYALSARGASLRRQVDDPSGRNPAASTDGP